MNEENRNNIITLNNVIATNEDNINRVIEILKLSDKLITPLLFETYKNFFVTDKLITFNSLMKFYSVLNLKNAERCFKKNWKETERFTKEKSPERLNIVLALCESTDWKIKKNK